MIRNISRNNKNWKRVGGGLLVTLLTVYLAGCSSQADSANKSAATSPSPSTSPVANATAPDASFKEAAMTWSHVEEARAKLDAAVGDSNFAGARETTAKMRDSLKALPDQSAALPSDKREQLAAQVKSVERMAGMLDEAAVANNADSVHEHHKAMDESLDTIKGLYPEGVMPASMPMDDKMGDKGMGMHGADKKMGDMPKKKDGMKMPMKDH
jgi:hypothetical protein